MPKKKVDQSQLQKPPDPKPPDPDSIAKILKDESKNIKDFISNYIRAETIKIREEYKEEVNSLRREMEVKERRIKKLEEVGFGADRGEL